MKTRDYDRVRPPERALEAVGKACRRAKDEGRAPRLLFVCLGNICRSPAAEGIMEGMAAARGVKVECDSAGLYGGHAGELPDPRMRKAAGQLGYVLTHRARKIQPDDLDRFDLIFGMDDENMDELEGMADSEEKSSKLLRLSDFAADHPTYDSIPDPYYGGPVGFRLALDLLEDACGNLVRVIR